MICYNNIMQDSMSQLQCQSRCLASTTCVGISTAPSLSVCLLCNDDKLHYRYGYSFYRRPGKTDLISKHWKSLDNIQLRNENFNFEIFI